jgi:hypothetical protein
MAKMGDSILLFIVLKIFFVVEINYKIYDKEFLAIIDAFEE